MLGELSLMATLSETKVYRIIGLESFMSILINKQERFVRPIDSWPDTFEGYMLHQLDSIEGMQKVIDRLYMISTENIDSTILSLSKLLRTRYTCYGQCWSRIPDSDAMWRIYSYDNKAIQLVTTVNRIQNMIKADAWKHLQMLISDVKYDINDEEEALNKILVPSARIVSAYFHKRPAFEHEKEIRVLLDDSKKYDYIDFFTANAIRNNLKHGDKTKPVTEQILDAATLTVGNKGSYTSASPSEIKMKINDLKSYLEGIRVHPLAPVWYVNLIKDICRNYKVRFLGQSDLYRATV